MKLPVLVVAPAASALGLCFFLAGSHPAHAGPPVYIPPAPPAPPAPPPGEKPEEKPPEVAPAPARVRLLVLELKGNDVDSATVKTLEGIVTAGLSDYRELDVVSGDDLKNLLRLEAERTTVGCSEDASCMAEIADALGAQLVVFGTAGRLGGDLVLNLNLFDSVKATGLGRVVVQAEDTRRIPRKLRPRLRDLVGKFYADRGLTLPPYVELPPDPEEVTASPLPWVVAVGGAVAFVTGGVLAAVGAVPLLQVDGAANRIREAQDRFAAEPGALDDAKAAQADLAQARGAWNSFGWLAVDAGAALAGVGLASGVVGWLWAMNTDAPGEPPASVSSPAAPATGGAR